MTEQQFKDLNIGQWITREGNVYKVVNTYPIQRIIIATGVLEVFAPFRYEDVELVVKDELVEYLSSLPIIIGKHDIADKIRQIVRKEIIDLLKFPTIIEVYGKRLNNSNQAFYDWFVEETKKLNR
jgi:hypothetical protein